MAFEGEFKSILPGTQCTMLGKESFSFLLILAAIIILSLIKQHMGLHSMVLVNLG